MLAERTADGLAVILAGEPTSEVVFLRSKPVTRSSEPTLSPSTTWDLIWLQKLPVRSNNRTASPGQLSGRWDGAPYMCLLYPRPAVEVFHPEIFHLQGQARAETVSHRGDLDIRNAAQQSSPQREIWRKAIGPEITFSFSPGRVGKSGAPKR